jgi:hypothetical protein
MVLEFQPFFHFWIGELTLIPNPSSNFGFEQPLASNVENPTQKSTPKNPG